jgi:hypothetical protein
LLSLGPSIARSLPDFSCALSCTRTRWPFQPRLHKFSRRVSRSVARIETARERTIDFHGIGPTLDGTVPQLSSIADVEDLGLQALLSSKTPGHVLEFLPSTMTGDLYAGCQCCRQWVACIPQLCLRRGQ